MVRLRLSLRLILATRSVRSFVFVLAGRSFFFMIAGIYARHSCDEQAR